MKKAYFSTTVHLFLISSPSQYHKNVFESSHLDQIPEYEKTPLVLSLLETIQLQAETIQQLKDEIARIKGNNPKPKVPPPSNLENKKKKKGKKGERAGSLKRSKTLF